MITKLFPILMICLSICSSLIYLINKDYKHFVYWLAASIMTYVVTF